VALSQDLCAGLEPDEFTAMLEHERTQVVQGHQAIKGVVETFAVLFSSVIATYAGVLLTGCTLP